MPESALEIFRDACGLQAPLTLECQDASRTMAGAVTYQLDCPFVLIGRDPRSDLILNNPQVSRRHAFVQVIEGRAYCLDLDSRTQLRWDEDTKSKSRGWLDAGSTFRIGPFALRRVGSELAGNDARPYPDPMDGRDNNWPDVNRVPVAGLDLPIRLGDSAHIWRMSGRLALVGRSEICQVMLRDPSVSRFHAALVRTAKGVWIIDLQAREGVQVNGVRVKWAWLEDGDTVRIGQFTSILRYESLPEQISRQEVPIEAGAMPPPSRALALPGKVGTSLARRSAASSATPSRVSQRPPAVKADVLVPEKVAEWEPTSPVAAQQVALWQQQMQMMESFHRDMILMVQMFVAMHREHRGAIRDELDRVERLTRKLSVLQKQLAENEANPSGALGVKSPPRNLDKPRRSARNGTNQGRPETESRAEIDSHRSVAPSPRDGDDNSLEAPAPGPEDRTSKAARSPTQDLNPAEFHSQLTRRITELQRERQTYWQRILSSINK